MCAISSLTSTFAISSPDEFLYINDKPLTERNVMASFCVLDFADKILNLRF